MRVEREWWEDSSRSDARAAARSRRSLRPAPESTSPELKILSDRLRDREAGVAIVGMGYVGLPLLVAASGAGFRTLGVEADPKRLLALRTGLSYVEDISDDELRGCEAEFDHDPAILDRADVVVICVPTPVDEQRRPDLRALRNACGSVVAHARAGQTIILTSTTYVGTTRDLLVEPLAARDPDLPVHEVQPRHHLRHRMFDLEPRVHLEEVEGSVAIALVEQELDRSGVRVLRGARDGSRGRGHLLTQGDADRDGRVFLDDLLMAALNRTFAFDKRHDRAESIGEELNLDVSRPGETAFEIDARIAERRASL